MRIVILLLFLFSFLQAQIGIASIYASSFNGATCASGIKLDITKFQAAHKSLPFGTKVKVTYIKTKKSVIVTIVDRGPFVANRIIDLTPAAAKKIGLLKDGIGKVQIKPLN